MRFVPRIAALLAVSSLVPFYGQAQGTSLGGASEALAIEDIIRLRSDDPVAFSELKSWTEGPTPAERKLYYKYIPGQRPRYVEKEDCWEAKRKGRIRAMISATISRSDEAALEHWNFAEEVLSKTKGIEREKVLEAKAENTSGVIQQKIAVRLARDQSWRKPLLDPEIQIDQRPEVFWLLWTGQCLVDSENLNWLRGFINQITDRPTDVPQDSLRGLANLVIHADRDLQLQKLYLKWFMTNRGVPADVIGSIAALSDRIAISEGRHQEYGTQFEIVDEKCFAPLSIDSVSEVDKRRKNIGLSPLSEYAKKLSLNTGSVICDGIF